MKAFKNCYIGLLLAHLVTGQLSLCHGAASGVRTVSTFPLNDFSRITRPISTKIGRKQSWLMGIPICTNQGVGLLRDYSRGEKADILTKL